MINKEGLFIGGASAVGGYLLASLLDKGINVKHHALTCNGKSCTSLGCADLAGCEGPCGNPFTSEKAMCVQQAERKANKPVTIPTEAAPKQQFSDILGTTPTSGTGSGGPTCNLGAADQDCCNYQGAGGLLDWACVAGKSISKGATNAACFPGLPIPCPILIVGALGIAILYLMRR